MNTRQVSPLTCVVPSYTQVERDQTCETQYPPLEVPDERLQKAIHQAQCQQPFRILANAIVERFLKLHDRCQYCIACNYSTESMTNENDSSR